MPVFTVVAGFFLATTLYAQNVKVPREKMEQVYNEIRTPYKYGLVVVPDSRTKMVDSPSIFRYEGIWYMTYIIFDGKGYETWIAQSDNLLQWKTLGRIMSFTHNTWDSNQKAGYIALQDYTWGGSYELEKHDGKYWMSYLGGAEQGYEAGMLGTGIAYTTNPTAVKEWNRLKNPVLLPTDADAGWYDNQVIYKSSVIHDREKKLGHPFVMFYNAMNKPSEIRSLTAERIAMAVSDDMIHWKRYGDDPVIDHYSGIAGDAFLSKMDDLWVMFYFGAFWRPGAFERFACSYDMINWTVWGGSDLINSSEPYDNVYAHKPLVIKYNGVVYHFYCAVGKNADGVEQRGIAVATSVDLGKSTCVFPNK